MISFARLAGIINQRACYPNGMHMHGNVVPARRKG